MKFKSNANNFMESCHATKAKAKAVQRNQLQQT